MEEIKRNLKMPQLLCLMIKDKVKESWRDISWLRSHENEDYSKILDQLFQKIA